MDLDRLDAVTRSLAVGGSRRTLLGVLAAIPAAAGLLGIFTPEDLEAKDRRHRRKQRHKKRKHPGGHKEGCRPKSKATVCARQCGPVKSRQTCGKTVDCGSCACPTPCDPCLICQSGPNTPGACVTDLEQVGESCGGNGGQTCAADGACRCDSGSCGGLTPICFGGACVPCSGNAPCPDGCCQDDGTCGATCRVFATSSTHSGDMDGLIGADAICQDLAEAAGLPGLYLAWLSAGTDSPNTRFPLAGDPAIGPYVLVGNPAATIAADWDALTNLPTCVVGQISPCLDQPIDRDETGAGFGSPFTAWTGTLPSGTAVSRTCEQWTNSTVNVVGHAGETNKSDARWTNAIGPTCNLGLRVYCFQQG